MGFILSVISLLQEGERKSKAVVDFNNFTNFYINEQADNVIILTFTILDGCSLLQITV